MSKGDASKGIKNPPATEQEAAKGLTQTIQSLIEESNRSTGRLEEMINLTRRTKTQIAAASARLQRHLRPQASRHKAPQDRTAVRMPGNSKPPARQGASPPAKIKPHHPAADFTALLSNGFRQCEEYLRKFIKVLVEQAPAITRISEAARVQVSLVAHRAASGATQFAPKLSLRRLKTQATQRRSRIQGLLASKRSLESKVSALTVKCERLKRERSAAREEVREQTKLLASKETLEEQVAELTAKCEHLDAARNTATTWLATAEAEVRDQKKQLASSEALQERFAKLSAKCERLARELAEVKAQLSAKSELLAAKGVLEHRLTELTAEREQLKDERAAAEAEVQAKTNLLASKEGLEEQLAQLTSECEELRNERAAAEAEVQAKTSLLASKEGLEEQLAQLNSECEELRNERAAAEAEVQAKTSLLASKEGLEEQLAQLNSECKQLRNERAATEAEDQTSIETQVLNEGLERRLTRLTAECEQLRTAQTEAVAEAQAKTSLLASKDGLERRLTELTTKCEQLEKERAAAKANVHSNGLEVITQALSAPVDAVISTIDLLRETRLDDQQRQHLRAADSSVAALLSLLDCVANLPRILDGGLELERTEVDLRQTLKDTVSMLTPIANNRGLELTCEVEPDLSALVQSDPKWLRQILLYLTSQSIQLASQGKVVIRATVEKMTEATNTIRFAVHFTSTAVSQETLDRAFPWHRHANEPATPNNDGDLTSALMRLVELLKGEMGVERQDNGTLAIWFTIAFDMAHKLGDARRAYGRLRQEALDCNLGAVLDLSLGGMRVQCNRPPKGEVDVELVGSEVKLRLRAQVVWTRRVGFRKYEVGLNFLRLPAETSKQLTRISLNHRVRRSFGPV
ncbi:MAG: PilZ domain-containing protein [Planctomycetes bacterium]|nr:PilZ domain-containing protein [Planctomycetota bacterium]